MRKYIGVLVAVLAIACSSKPPSNGPESGGGDTVISMGKGPSSQPESAKWAAKAVDVLASELKISKEAITVKEVRAVEWPDSSLGCPQPDQFYMQMMTPGHKITLQAKGKLYYVHQGQDRLIVCPKAESS